MHKTAAARNYAPMYARFIKPFGLRLRGEATDRKNAAGGTVAWIRAPVRAIHLKKSASTASSTYRNMNLGRLFSVSRIQVEISSQLTLTSTTYPKPKPARKNFGRPRESRSCSCDGGRRVTFVARFCRSWRGAFERGAGRNPNPTP
jgi:hypothetical protein